MDNPHGLIDGIVLDRLGCCGENDFEFFDGHIIKGGRKESVHHVMVLPAEGYNFEMDQRTLWYLPVKHFAEPQVVTLRISAHNSLQSKELENFSRYLKNTNLTVEVLP